MGGFFAFRNALAGCLTNAPLCIVFHILWQDSLAKPGRRRSESSRQQILEATLAGLIRLGFSGLTIEGIAAEAGVSKATIYRWWPSKEWLVMEVLLQLSNQWVPVEVGPVRDALVMQLGRWVEHASSPAGVALTAVVQAAAQDPKLGEVYLQGYLEPRREQLKIFFGGAQERGELRSDADLQEMMDALYGPIYFRTIVRRQDCRPEFCERVVDNFLLCYGAGPALLN